MKVEEYIREFEEFLITCVLMEEHEQIIARFLKGLNSTILKKIELQLFWTFEDTCKLAVKVKKQQRDLFNCSSKTVSFSKAFQFIPIRSSFYRRQGQGKWKQSC